MLLLKVSWQPSYATPPIVQFAGLGDGDGEGVGVGLAGGSPLVLSIGTEAGTVAFTSFLLRAIRAVAVVQCLNGVPELATSPMAKKMVRLVPVDWFTKMEKVPTSASPTVTARKLALSVKKYLLDWKQLKDLHARR